MAFAETGFQNDQITQQIVYENMMHQNVFVGGN
jgi:hypothetical protein